LSQNPVWFSDCLSNELQQKWLCQFWDETFRRLSRVFVSAYWMLSFLEHFPSQRSCPAIRGYVELLWPTTSARALSLHPDSTDSHGNETSLVFQPNGTFKWLWSQVASQANGTFKWLWSQVASQLISVITWNTEKSQNGCFKLLNSGWCVM
jgi:hypothetical protein